MFPYIDSAIDVHIIRDIQSRPVPRHILFI